MKQTYLFYDIETTGLNKAFDQILQFAAIRTTASLQEINRYEFKIKLNPDCIPSPFATITHHIGVKEAMEGICEIDAVLSIHRILNEPGTISLGYNSLGFDDEFLRFSFYRNLLPPYTHQFANQCSRMDLYPITVLYYLFKNDIIRWPLNADQPSMKLEHINAANEFVSGRSHNAMIDVEVTLALAQRLFSERKMWDYAVDYFNKRADQARIMQLPRTLQNKYHEAIMLDGVFGARQQYQCPALYLGEHNHYKNQGLWLQLDRDILEETKPEKTWIIRKKWGEPGFILPPKERFSAHLTEARQALATANKVWLERNPKMLQQIIDYHRSYTYPTFPDADLDSALYINGFWTDAELAFCKRFHEVTPAKKAKLTEQLTNPNLQELAVRLLGRHYPETLTPRQQQQFAEYMKRISPSDKTLTLIDYKGEKRLTPQVACDELAQLSSEPHITVEQRRLLEELKTHLHCTFTSHSLQ